MELKPLIANKPRGKKGGGRTVKFVPVNLPVDIVEDLKLYRLIYSEFLDGESVSFESMLLHWFRIIGKSEPKIQRAFEQAKKIRNEHDEAMATKLGITVTQLKENEASFDPAAVENEPWKLRYFFEKDGEELEAFTGEKAPFFTKVDGRNVGMKEMLAEGWNLQNEIGCELDMDQAWRINKLIKEHQGERD